MKTITNTIVITALLSFALLSCETENKGDARRDLPSGIVITNSLDRDTLTLTYNNQNQLIGFAEKKNGQTLYTWTIEYGTGQTVSKLTYTYREASISRDTSLVYTPRYADNQVIIPIDGNDNDSLRITLSIGGRLTTRMESQNFTRALTYRNGYLISDSIRYNRSGYTKRNFIYFDGQTEQNLPNALTHNSGFRNAFRDVESPDWLFLFFFPDEGAVFCPSSPHLPVRVEGEDLNNSIAYAMNAGSYVLSASHNHLKADNPVPSVALRVAYTYISAK